MAHIVRERKIYTRCVYLKLVSFNETRTHAENGGKRGREKKTNIIQYNPNDNNSNRSLQSCAVNCRRRWRRQRRGAAKTRDAFIYLSYIVFVFNQNTDRHQQKKQRTEKKRWYEPCGQSCDSRPASTHRVRGQNEEVIACGMLCEQLVAEKMFVFSLSLYFFFFFFVCRRHPSTTPYSCSHFPPQHFFVLPAYFSTFVCSFTPPFVVLGCARSVWFGVSP